MATQPEPISPEQAEHLRSVAGRQRYLLYCILAYFALMGMTYTAASKKMTLPPQLLEIAAAVVSCSSLIFGFMLARKVFGMAGGVICALLLISPIASWLIGQREASLMLGLVSLLVLVVINMRATKILKTAGIPVGFMGASDIDIDKRIRR